MKIILVRHGDADADIPEGLEDDARALTTRSRLALPAHFAALGERIGVPTIIYMSPLVRAVQTATLLAPLVSVVPLQIFACELATAKGLDVDQPRNLAKSVTVE